MKKILVIVFLCLTQVSCHHQNANVPPVITKLRDVMVDCAKDSVKKNGGNYVTIVTENLLSESYDSLLTDLALSVGVDEISCVVRYVVSEALKDSVLAKTDENTRNTILNGRAWLDNHAIGFRDANRI